MYFKYNAPTLESFIRSFTGMSSSPNFLKHVFMVFSTYVLTSIVKVVERNVRCGKKRDFLTKKIRKFVDHKPTKLLFSRYNVTLFFN